MSFWFLWLPNLQNKVLSCNSEVLTLNNSSCFGCYKTNSSMFLHIFNSFLKHCIVHYIEKIFFGIIFCIFLRSVSKLMYYISQDFRLNLMISTFFFKTIPRFNACFKFLMWIKFSSFSWKLATSFSIFILSGKKGKLLWGSCNFQGF